MIRIRRVVDDALLTDRTVIGRAQDLLAERFPSAPPADVQDLAGRLRNPFEQGFRILLYVAEGAHGRLRGCALAGHDPVAGFVLLEWLAADERETGGVGASLFARLRDDAEQLGCAGVFLESPADDVPDPIERRENARRLAFYERLDARPLVGTAYRDPVNADPETHYPWLLWCPTPADAALPAEQLQRVIRAILGRKYGELCPPEYVEHVVRSVQDPVERRPPRYANRRRPAAPSPGATRVGLVVHEGHGLHQVRERGYVQAPARVDRILAVLEPSGWFERRPAEVCPTETLMAVHDPQYLEWLERVCASIVPDRRVYPYVFPVRNQARLPDDLEMRAGYYCLDTFTPLHRDLYAVARGAADCAYTASLLVGQSHRVAYALVRPPGHHAERGRFGGFCYLSNMAIAARALQSRGARVAILDVDYHHGNGQQEIFYRDPEVLTVSLHGDPSLAYPHFTGFAEEGGEGDGVGYNLNLPLPEHLDGEGYRAALAVALGRVAEHRPDVLVVGLGLDTARGDPTGTWSLREGDFYENGRRIGALGLPTLVAQEGGYGLRALGRNALAFLVGVAGG